MDDAPDPGRLPLEAALAFAFAVAVAHRESAVSTLLEGISEHLATDRLDELESRIAWAPACLWDRRDASADPCHRAEIEQAGFAGLSAGLVAAKVLAHGRARFGAVSGPVEARHIETSDAIFVALVAATEADNRAVERALSIVLEAIEKSDEQRLAAFFSESDVSADDN